MISKNKELFQRVKELNLPSGKYALFGSAPMCIRGWKDCSHDLDLIVTEDLWNEYREKSGWIVRVMEHGSQYLWNNDIELWKDWGPGDWDVKGLIGEAEVIQGLPFVKLEHVMAWKKLCGREKDIHHVKIIEEQLKKQR